MSEMRSVPGILDVIERITSNHESGRLEIDAQGTPGTLLFNEGKLVHAGLGSLKGFQAVNAVVALRDMQFSFDHVTPASHLSTITQNERVVLKRFFGIEAAEMEEPHETVEPDWNPEPEPVVPLTLVEEIRQIDLEETPTVEVSPVRSPSFDAAGQSSFSAPRVAAGLALLLLVLTVGTIAVRSKLKATQQSAAVAAAVEVAPSAAPVAEPEVKPAAVESPSEPASRQSNARVKVESPAPVVSTVRRESDDARASGAAKIRDLTGEWQVINTVEKTGYKSFDKMQLGFRLKIDQKGKQFTAKGEKFSENGQTLPAGSRTPIHVTGSIEGDQIVAEFVEDGRKRRSNGRFVWTLQNGSDALVGTFVSTAANSRGRSALTKQ